MTKHRAPLSLDAALARIAGQLPGHWAEMAVAASRKERTVRNWGDPDSAESIPMDCAIALDIAFQAAGGTGAPIFESYALQLEMGCMARFADSQALGRHAALVIHETGEASAAIVLASQPGATPADRAHAAREVDEALGVLKQAASLLQHAQPP